MDLPVKFFCAPLIYESNPSTWKNEDVSLQDIEQMRELYPEIPEEELEQAAMNFNRYAKVMLRMFEKWKRKKDISDEFES